jgi:hypothetical protein
VNNHPGSSRERGAKGRLKAAAWISCALAVGFAPAQTLDVKGQASVWLALNDARPRNLRFGLRYIPALSFSTAAGKDLTLDAEVSANAYLNGESPGGAFAIQSREIKLYRGWVRLATTRFEARAGLQKINFGSATVLRPLMWFDRIDPRDPLQITDGVTGLLLRYYFPGNANVWAWGLYGNEATKGWETSPTARRSAEFGGRVQVPVPRGDLGPRGGALVRGSARPAKNGGPGFSRRAADQRRRRLRLRTGERASGSGRAPRRQGGSGTVP